MLFRSSFYHIFMLFQPERIDPKNFGHGYDVRSDVWSLGITLVGNSVECVHNFGSFFVVSRNISGR